MKQFSAYLASHLPSSHTHSIEPKLYTFSNVSARGVQFYNTMRVKRRHGTHTHNN